VGCRIGGRARETSSGDEIPLLRSSLCSSRETQTAAAGFAGSVPKRVFSFRAMANPFSDVSPVRRGDVWTRDIGQMGSLAGAAYLLQSNAGVLRHAP